MRITPQRFKTIVRVYWLLLAVAVGVNVLGTLLASPELSLDALADEINAGNVDTIYIYPAAGETYLTADVRDEERHLVTGVIRGDDDEFLFNALVVLGTDPAQIAAINFRVEGGTRPHTNQAAIEAAMLLLRAAVLVGFVVVMGLFVFTQRNPAV